MIARLPHRLHVVAGVLRDAVGRVLICERPPGKHMAGDWEFPGGKRHGHESRLEALERELDEELGVRLGSARPLIRYRHAYPDRTIDLDVWLVDNYVGEPAGREGQALEWLPEERLAGRGLLLADRPIVTALQLGSLCLVTGPYRDLEDFRERLVRALDRGASLVQIRDHGITEAGLREILTMAVPTCHRRGARLVVNGDPAITAPLVAEMDADGLHLPSRHIGASIPASVSANLLLGASCHDERELCRAVAHGMDYAVLGPVAETHSHPGAPGMGWRRFRELVASLAIPVYGIGGLSADSLNTAWEHGAQGVAAITSIWS